MNSVPSRRDTVRAALGRLFRRARSHRLPFAVTQSHAGSTNALHFHAVTQPGELSLRAASHVWSVPHASAGGGGLNLAAMSTNVSAGTSCPLARSLPLALPAPQTVSVTGTDWPTAPPTAAVPVLPRAARAVRADFHGARGQSRAVRLLSPRARPAHSGTDWFTERVPLLRERLPAEHGNAASARVRLAAASGADEADIQVAGVYPRVPLTRVRQMALVNGGQHLRLWLHPPEGRRPSRLWTVTLGRLRSTGRTVQTIMEDI